MHEMSIAMNILTIACDEAQKTGAHSISRIDLDIGMLAGIMTDSLQFCYNSACKGTLAEGSTLTINEIPAKATCQTCEHTFEIHAFMAMCPHCQGHKIDIVQGREMQLKSVRVT